MKKLFTLLSISVLSLTCFGQYSRLGWTNDVQMQYDEMRYHTYENNQKTEVLRFHNVNCRFAGSLIGTAIFENDTRFFIGEYFDLGFGVGIGKKHSGTYAGTSFNMLLGANLGLVSCYNINDDLTVGLKYIAWGGDVYFDFDEGAVFFNGMTFYPTVRYGKLQASVGFGGRKLKSINGDSKILDCDLKYSFSNTPDDSWYVGLKYRRSGVVSRYDDDASVDKLSVGSLMFTCGFYW
jgi:hypothetical protein